MKNYVALVTLLWITIKCYATQSTAALSSIYELELNIEKVAPNAVVLRFKNTPLAPSENYYFCVQIINRWYEFKEYCDTTVLATSAKEWIEARMDQLDYWGREYHARVNLCHSKSKLMIYCDLSTVRAELVTQSGTVTFRTTSPHQHQNTNSTEVGWYVGSGIVVCVLLAIIVSQGLVWRAYRRERARIDKLINRLEEREWKESQVKFLITPDWSPWQHPGSNNSSYDVNTDTASLVST